MFIAMKLIVGLGNPGEKYEHTRHNLGFAVIERFLKDVEPVNKTVWQEEKKFKSDIAEINWQPKFGNAEKVILAKPKTFMNNSGQAVALLMQFYKIKADDVWVVHDDIDLEIGMMRIRMGGSSAGHRGVESIIESIGTEKFWRFRLGIGHPKHGNDAKHHKENQRDVDDFVLGIFTHGEAGKVRELIKHATKAIKGALEDGLLAAMNHYNTR